MFEDSIRNFDVLILAIYSFYKLLNLLPQSKFLHLFFVASSILISTISTFFFGDALSINWIFILLIYFLLMFLTSRLVISITYITVLFSYALSFITFNLCAIITGVALLPFYNKNYEIPWFIVRILGAILHFLLIYYCFCLPRLQRGMKFLYYIPSNNVGSTICIILIMAFIMTFQNQTYSGMFVLKVSIASLLSGFLLIYWWNYHITQTYRKYLKKNELDSLNLLLEERDQEITYLRNENDKLARLIHKDNKLIPALSMAIIESYENDTKLDLSALDSDSSLHMKLKQLYEERMEILAAYEKERLKLPETKFHSINAVLSYMRNEALKLKITYQIMLFDDLATTIPGKITEDDFIHILSDLLTNSLNACIDTDSAFIQIYLGIIDEISTIKIYNNGKEFSMETLQNLGLARHTTHASTGGSGIGMMDIWRLKENYKATLLIDEITDESVETYTCINILFNHKNHFIVQSDRHKELSTYINRPDIMILSKE